MNTAWIILGLCFLILLGAALPLLHRGPQLPDKNDKPQDH